MAASLFRLLRLQSVFGGAGGKVLRPALAVVRVGGRRRGPGVPPPHWSGAAFLLAAFFCVRQAFLLFLIRRFLRGDIDSPLLVGKSVFISLFVVSLSREV